MPDPNNQTPEQRIKELELQLKNDYGVSIVKKRPGKFYRNGRSRS